MPEKTPIYINARFLTQRLTGVQFYALEISKRLKNSKEEIIFVCPPNIIHKELAKELDAKIIGKNSGHLWEQIDLPRFLKSTRKNPLLINFANTAPLFYKNQIVTVHDVAFLENSKWYNYKLSWFYSFLIPKIVRRAAVVFTVSEFSSKEIQKHISIPDSKIKIIPCGYRELPLSNKTENGEIFFLAVGSINPRKNHSLILETFNSNEFNSSLYIVGGKDASFNNAETTKNKLNFLGYTDDETLNHLYSSSKAFISASLYEGFNLPILEAICQECPVIVSDIPVHREIYGDIPYYFEVGSTESLKKTINYVLDHYEEAKQKTIEGKNKLIFFYNFDHSSDKVINVIKTLY